MNRQLFRVGSQMGRVVIQNAPTILAIASGIGVVTTAVVGVKTGIKASRVLEELEYTSPEPPTTKDKIKAVAPKSIPLILSGSATIFCIFAARKMHLQRQAAVAAALVAANNRFEEYRGQVLKEVGKEKENRLMNNAAQERINKNPPSNNGENGMNLIRTRFGDILFMDSFSGRYFLSSYEAVNKAIIQVTKIAQRDMWANLNDFYDALEIPQTDGGEMLGWNILDISESTLDPVVSIVTNRTCKTPTPEQLPCTVIDYEVEPIVNYNKMF